MGKTALYGDEGKAVGSHMAEGSAVRRLGQEHLVSVNASHSSWPVLSCNADEIRCPRSIRFAPESGIVRVKSTLFKLMGITLKVKMGN
jgi:hypothetical protein